MSRKLNSINPQVAQENNFLQRYVYNNSLSINDIKLFKAILSKVKYNDSLFDDSYAIEYNRLDIVGISKNNRYKEIEKSLIKLMNTFVTIREEDRENFEDVLMKNTKGNRTLGLIKNDWIHEKQSSKIIISIPEILKPFFLELADKEYTIYSLENICDLKSVYEIKMYELFSRWKNRGFFNITISNLRKYLQIEDGKYPEFSNFKQRVLKKSVDSISEHTNLSIICRELNEKGDIVSNKRGHGNKVNSVEFLITEKNKFVAEKYISKTFVGSDKKKYIILEIKENEDGLLFVKLFDSQISSVTSLMKPISKEDFVKSIELE